MKKLALAAFLFVVGAIGWRALRSDAPDTRLVFDRFWVDHQPRSETDVFQGLWLNGLHPFGSFGTRTAWKGQWEAFHYHVIPRSDGQLDLVLPASNLRERVTFRARTCSEKGFDYCLEVTGNSRGAHRYYSRKQWQISDGNVDAKALDLTDDK